MRNSKTQLLSISLLLLTLAACKADHDAAHPDHATEKAAIAPGVSADQVNSQAPADQEQATPLEKSAFPLVVVHKLATCNCCAKWVDHLRKAGFTVEERVVENMTPVKDRLGVPVDKRSCHTAEVGGYFVEGHVPAEDIKRLLTEKPSAKGLTVPGMPAGSPGMEMPDGKTETYVVSLVGRDGSTDAYAQHGQGPIAAATMEHEHDHAEE